MNNKENLIKLFNIYLNMFCFFLWIYIFLPMIKIIFGKSSWNNYYYKYNLILLLNVWIYIIIYHNNMNTISSIIFICFINQGNFLGSLLHYDYISSAFNMKRNKFERIFHWAIKQNPKNFNIQCCFIIMCKIFILLRI